MTIEPLRKINSESDIARLACRKSEEPYGAARGKIPGKIPLAFSMIGAA
jgi:hypothetical protein